MNPPAKDDALIYVYPEDPDSLNPITTNDETSAELLERALRAPLSGSWKEELRERRSTG